MPALSLIRGWSVAILLSFFLRLSFAQVFGGFEVNPNPSPTTYSESSAQTISYTSSYTANEVVSPGPPSSNIFTSTAVQTFFPFSNETSTSSVDSTTSISPYTFIGTANSIITWSDSFALPSASSAVISGGPPTPASVIYSTAVPSGLSSIAQTSSFSTAVAFTTSQVASLSSIVASPISAPISSSIIAQSSTAPFPATVSNFELVGCAASSNGYQDFQLSENSTAMTIERCASDCRASAFAGIFDSLCYCGNTNVSSSVRITDRGACNLPCPGNPTQMCGGRISRIMRILKRQAPIVDMLLTLYANPEIVNSSLSLTTIATMPTSSLPTTSQSPLNMTGMSSIHTMVLTTVYVDICSTGYTTKTTTLTTTHCGCTLPGASGIQTPSIPMTTVEKICSVCDVAGDDSLKTVTLTLPDTSAMASQTVNTAARPAEASNPSNSGTAPNSASPPVTPLAGSDAAKPSSSQLPQPSSQSSPSNNPARPGSESIEAPPATTDIRRVTLLSTTPTDLAVYRGGASTVTPAALLGLLVMAVLLMMPAAF